MKYWAGAAFVSRAYGCKMPAAGKTGLRMPAKKPLGTAALQPME
jgi:hypothetical protein